jgi:hypothetical protein
MANIKVIAEHSVDLDLLTGGICIDVGCRGFQFSEAMRDMGLEVHAYDIEEMTPPEGIRFGQVAILDRCGWAKYIDTKDQQAKYISDSGIDVECRDINNIIELLHSETGKSIDVIKIDAEGSEYFILPHLSARELPRQLSIEFHMHAHQQLHYQYYEKCMENLLKYYEPVQHELTQAHGAGWNYWDSLFIRRDLL